MPSSQGATQYISTSRDNRIEGSALTISGKGVQKSNSVQLEKWAKRKLISQSMSLNLVDVAKRKGKPDMVKRYWNTYHCINRFYSGGETLHAKYCKNRVCTICSANRKAHLINKYYPLVKGWNDAHFVTLTIKAIPAKHLRRYFKGMTKELGKILANQRKRMLRKGCTQLRGLRSLECNFNPKARTYNPHFHLIVETKEMADILVTEWLKRFPKKYAVSWAQKVLKIDSIENNLIEIIKYGTKIFTEMDLKYKKSKGVSRYVYISALDNILTAMSGTRIFERFGLDVKPEAKPKSTIQTIVLEEFVYNANIHDWFNPKTGEVLAMYVPTSDLQKILNTQIEADIE